MRHASWGNKKCDRCRKCESSVKVCVTHLRMKRRSEFVFSLEWLICGMECTVGARRIVKLPSMPKLYLGPGLSQRVHRALRQRLERFMANAAAPAETAFPVSENPPIPAQTGTVDLESEKGEEQGAHHSDEGNKSPADKEDKEDKEEREAGRDDDRSRSPRLRMHEPFDPNDAADLLSSTTGLAVGITSMFAALKGSTDRLDTLIKSTHTLQQDLCRSLEAVGEAVNNTARASESLAAGVNHNTSRVGAVVGEYTKLKKHLEWALNVSMGDVLKKNNQNRAERDQSQKEVMDQLYEAMDKLQENMKLVAERIEKGTPTEGAPVYDPPQPPMGHPGMSQSSPSTAPLTPAPGVSLGPSHLPPPPSVPPMVPPRPMMAPQPSLPVAKFVGYSPAKMGELPMSYPLALEVKDVKSPPCQVLEETTGRIRCVSPTARHDPATGTAAFSPLGYVQIQGTREYRRVYP